DLVLVAASLRWCGILVAGGGQRLDRGKITARDGGDKPVAIHLEQLLHALDRISVIVEQMPDALQEIDVLGAVIAPSAAALHRLDLRETSLPETQHMLRQVEIVGNFADGAESVRALFHSTLDERLRHRHNGALANRIHFSGLSSGIQVSNCRRPAIGMKIAQAAGEAGFSFALRERWDFSTRCFSTFDALKVMTRRGEIGTSSP